MNAPHSEGAHTPIVSFAPPGYRLAFRSRHGRKRWTPLALDSDREALLVAHTQGQPFTAQAETKAGHRWPIQGDWLGVYSIRADRAKGPQCHWCALDFDLAAGDHARGLSSPDLVNLAATTGLALWSEAGLAPVLERSHSGLGWHVWALLPDEVPAAFAHWLGAMTRGAIEHETGISAGDVESFPKSDGQKGQWGGLLALPLPGLQRGPDGGQFFFSAQSRMETPSDLPRADPLAVRKLIDQWDRAERAREQTQRQRLLNRPPPSGGGDDGGGLFDGITCEQVARAVGRVTGESADTLFLECPRHASRSGTSLHVSRSGAGWYCFSCQSGGGSFLLARWLLGDDLSAGELAAKVLA